MSPQETSGMSFASLFQFSAIPYGSGNNCPLVNVSLGLYLALSSFCLYFIEITRRTPGSAFRHVCLCLTTKKSACAQKCKQSFTEQAVSKDLIKIV